MSILGGGAQGYYEGLPFSLDDGRTADLVVCDPVATEGDFQVGAYRPPDSSSGIDCRQINGQARKRKLDEVGSPDYATAKRAKCSNNLDLISASHDLSVPNTDDSAERQYPFDLTSQHTVPVHPSPLFGEPFGECCSGSSIDIFDPPIHAIGPPIHIISPPTNPSLHPSTQVQDPADSPETAVVPVNPSGNGKRGLSCKLERDARSAVLMERLADILGKHGYGVKYKAFLPREPLLQAHDILHDIASKTSKYDNIIGGFRAGSKSLSPPTSLDFYDTLSAFRKLFAASVWRPSAIQFMKWFNKYFDTLLLEASQYINEDRINSNQVGDPRGANYSVFCYKLSTLLQRHGLEEGQHSGSVKNAMIRSVRIMKNIVQESGLRKDELDCLLDTKFPRTAQMTPREMYAEFQDLFKGRIDDPFMDNFIPFFDDLIAKAKTTLSTGQILGERSVPRATTSSQTRKKILESIGELAGVLDRHGYGVEHKKSSNKPIVQAYRLLRKLAEQGDIRERILDGPPGDEPVFPRSGYGALKVLQDVVEGSRIGKSGLLFMKDFLPFFDNLLTKYKHRLGDHDPTDRSIEVAFEQSGEQARKRKLTELGSSDYPTAKRARFCSSLELLNASDDLSVPNADDIEWTSPPVSPSQHVAPELLFPSWGDAFAGESSLESAIDTYIPPVDFVHQISNTQIQEPTDNTETPVVIANPRSSGDRGTLQRQTYNAQLAAEMEQLAGILKESGYGVDYRAILPKEPLFKAHEILHDIASNTSNYDDTIGEFRAESESLRPGSRLTFRAALTAFQKLFAKSVVHQNSAHFIEWFNGYFERLIVEAAEYIKVPKSGAPQAETSGRITCSGSKQSLSRVSVEHGLDTPVTGAKQLLPAEDILGEQNPPPVATSNKARKEFHQSVKDLADILRKHAFPVQPMSRPPSAPIIDAYMILKRLAEQGVNPRALAGFLGDEPQFPRSKESAFKVLRTPLVGVLPSSTRPLFMKAFLPFFDQLLTEHRDKVGTLQPSGKAQIY